MAPRFSSRHITATTAVCMCGKLATERSEAGGYFCTEHLPRRAPIAAPRPALPPAKPAPAPRQGELFGRA